MFVYNRYHIVYFQLVNKAISEKRSRSDNRYYEMHHIIPKCLNPDIANLAQHPENGVLLTAKEHIVAHRLLCKFTTGAAQRSCLRAYHFMCFQNNGGQNKRYPSAHQLAKGREAIRLANIGVKREEKAPEWSKCQTFEEFRSYLQNLVSQGQSDPQIGRHHGISAAAVHTWKKKLGIQKRRWQLRDPDWLRREYENMRTAQDIADEIGCTASAVQQKLLQYGIPVRSGSERWDAWRERNK